MSERIRALVQTQIDWDSMFELAAINSVAPLVCRTLETVAPQAVPSALRAEMELRVQASAMQNGFLAAQLAELARVVDGAGVPALYFKGPLLATAIYGDLSLREFHDLDVLVPPNGFQRAAEALEAHGYTLRAHHGWAAMFARGPVCIDVHQAILPPAYPIPPPFDGWWSRRQHVELAGVRVPTLCSEDLLVLLAAQAARDTWQWTLHLQKICDIAETATAAPGLDWRAVELEAGRLHVRWIVAFGLQLAVRFLDTELPEAAGRAADAPAAVRSLVEQKRQGFFETSPGETSPLRFAEFHARVRERIRDRLRPYWSSRHILWAPNANDRQLISLPRWLSALYYIIRPLRLLWRHGVPSLSPRPPARTPRVNKS
jgi:hypothetical protein